MNKRAYLVVGVLVVVALVFAFSGKVTVVNADTTVSGEYGHGKKVQFRNSAKLTVDGNLTIDKTFQCDGHGPLRIMVNGDATIKGKLKCDLTDESMDEVGNGIILVVSGKITFDKSSVVETNGHVQIVTKEEDVLTTAAQIDTAYEAAARADGTGPRIGPMIEGTGEVQGATTTTTYKTSNSTIPGWLIKTAHAQNPTDKDGNIIPNVIIAGNWVIGEGGTPPSGVQVPTPKKGVHKIILNFDFGVDGNVTFQDFHLVGPDGEDGESDEGKSCTAKGLDGKNAMRFNVVAKNIDINNLRLELGNGGNGGIATTIKDCDPGKATGGKGGEAGNFKMSASSGITINSFTIVPGRGGQGGTATALGKDGVDGCPGINGGAAEAIGGQGGDNKKELSANGSVSGLVNVEIKDVVGGVGGDAIANPGKGGNGTGCNCDGGKGGKATATAGNGGKASISASGDVAVGAANGGDGGSAEATGGMGGNGGACPMAPSGGDGGAGGDATGKAGIGGVGTTANGIDGEVKVEKGGDGGNGGDGCGPGDGGKGGVARDPGKDGLPGKLACPEGETPMDDGSLTTPDDDEIIETDDDADVNVEEEVEAEAVLEIDKPNLSFVHNIGSTACPTPIGTAKFTATGVDKWKVEGAVPAWLQVNTSGNISDGITAKFTCQLQSYTTQALNTTLNITGLDKNGEPVGVSTTLKVSGQVNAEQQGGGLY